VETKVSPDSKDHLDSSVKWVLPDWMDYRASKAKRARTEMPAFRAKMDSPDSMEYPESEAMTPVKKMLFLENLVCLDLPVCVVTKVNLDLKERSALPEIGPDTRACRDLKECLETKVQRVKEENWVLWVWLVSLAAKENKDLPVFPGLENPV